MFFLGESSPIDDGSANPGNSNIFDGWAETADSVLVMNATHWATRRDPPPGDLTAPTVTLTSPNGGEDWKAGSTHALAWTASDAVGVTGVDLAWSSDAGATWPNAIASSLANSGSFAWLVPDVPGGSMRVRATARDAANNSGSDASNGNFAISRWQVTTSAGAGGSVSPNGVTGVAEHGNVNVSITPSAGFVVADVLVDGGSVGPVSAWSFGDVTANHALAASFADVAPPSLVLTSPVGGETWDMSTSHDVTWTSSDNTAMDSVNVDWSAQGITGPWQTVAHALANDGSHTWALPASPTDSALVRVTVFDPGGNITTRTRQELFRIVDSNLGVGVAGPSLLALSRPQPNPAHGATLLAFSLPGEGEARLEIVDVSGRRVWARREALAAGAHAWRWPGLDAAGSAAGPGLYLVRLTTPWGVRTTRLAWMK